MARFNVSPEIIAIVDPNRIEVIGRRFEEYRGDVSVITLRERNGKWTVGSSMCFPSNINDAKRIAECHNVAFDLLKSIGE